MCILLVVHLLSSVARTPLFSPSCFVVRYKIILKDKVPAAGDDKKRSTDLLFKYDKTKKEWQLGKTKVRPRNILSDFKMSFGVFNLFPPAPAVFVGVHERVFRAPFGERSG